MARYRGMNPNFYLTDTEKTVAKMVLKGETLETIAQRTHYSQGKVRQAVNSLKRKAGTSSVRDAALEFKKAGII